MKGPINGDVRLRGWYFPINSCKKMHRDFIKDSPINRRILPNETIYRKILVTLFRKIFKEIIFNGYEFKLRRLGKFSCVKYLPSVALVEGKVVTNKLINYNETFKIRAATGNYGLKVYFDNRETGGYIYKIDWDTTRTHFVNKSLYRFKLEDSLKQLFKEGMASGEVKARIITKTL